VLNPSSPLPLYQQLAELLSRDITSGALGPGSRLPSEPELVKRHHIGRPTVRQATELLVQRGLIERRRGSGTYVCPPPRRVDLFSLGGTTVGFRAAGVEPTTKLLGKVSLRAVGRDADNPLSEQQAFVLSRLSSVERRPVLFERLYFSPSVFPDLDRLALAGASLSRVVEEHFYLKPTHAEQSFRVALPPEDVREALQQPAQSPLLLVKRVLYFPRAPRAVFCELFCRTEELVFSQVIGAEVRHD
jgi:GntR family transcriptional regulator